MAGLRCCIACKHFSLEMGCHGYSEYTPGYPASITCGKGFFYLGPSDDLEPAKDFLVYANDCQHYELSDMAKEAGWPP